MEGDGAIDGGWLGFPLNGVVTYKIMCLHFIENYYLSSSVIPKPLILD